MCFTKEELNAFADMKMKYIKERIYRWNRKLDSYHYYYRYKKNNGNWADVGIHVVQKTEHEIAIFYRIDGTYESIEMKKAASSLCRKMRKKVIEDPKNRLKYLTGLKKVSLGSDVIEDEEQFDLETKRLRKEAAKKAQGMKKVEVESLSHSIHSFFQHVNEPIPSERDRIYVLIGRGRDFGYLIGLLQELNIATGEKWINGYYKIDVEINGMKMEKRMDLSLISDFLNSLGFRSRVVITSKELNLK